MPKYFITLAECEDPEHLLGDLPLLLLRHLHHPLGDFLILSCAPALPSSSSSWWLPHTIFCSCFAIFIILSVTSSHFIMFILLCYFIAQGSIPKGCLSKCTNIWFLVTKYLCQVCSECRCCCCRQPKCCKPGARQSMLENAPPPLRSAS